MLLRNRSRAVTKPSLMGDHSSQPCPNQSYKRTIPSIFSPKFRDFTVKCFSGAEALRSPTSILDTRALFPPFVKTVSHENKTETLTSPPRVHTENKSMWDSKCIGLALVGALKDEPVAQNSAKPNSGSVLFGTKLRVKQDRACVANDFGAKTKDSPLSVGTGVMSGSVLFGTKLRVKQDRACVANDFGAKTKDSPLSVGTGVMSLSEMELSEEYTCVIAHGPNPRTTHIFDNCIVESYCSLPNTPHSPSLNFLSFCHTCKKHLEHTKDIFIYRGEKAFCSQECRHQEMLLDEADRI